MLSDFISLSSRAELEEWMDSQCPYEDYRACIHDLEAVNRLLRGYQPTLRWLSDYMRKHNDPMHIVDVGCGDLHRSMFSYLAFSALAWVMRWHPFVRHDGPISIRRGFRHADWVRMCQAAHLPMNEILIQRNAFGRLCVSRIKP